jgi:uncharacterized membrane protein YfcA
MDPLLVLFGFGVGILVGTTGMGGGSLMTPLLILLFGIKPVVAVGTDLGYAAVTKTVGGIRHFHKGTVQLDIAGWLAVGSVPGALGGVAILELFNLEDHLILPIALSLGLTGALILARALVLTGAGEREEIALDTRHKAFAAMLGLSVGTLLGVTSAGSGTLIAVGLILGFRLTPRRVVGTDVAHAAVLLWVAALAHLISGNVDLALAGTLLLGSVPGVWVGTGLATRLPERGLRPALGIVMFTSGLALLTKAGVDIPALALVAVPFALGLGSYAILRRGATSPAASPARRAPGPPAPHTPPR